MPTIVLMALLIRSGAFGAVRDGEDTALAVYRRNPYYFCSSDGNPVVLIGDYTWGTFSDVDYDYKAMFETLKANSLNFARVWVWWGCEEFPEPINRVHVEPYLRTGPGVANDGRPKYDLTRFNPAFFERLRDVCRAAQERGIFLQLTLFDAWMIKHPHLWRLHAYHRDNNVNGVDGDPQNTGTGTDGRQGFCSLGNSKVLEAQKAFIRKVVDAVNEFDNIFFEIANENYYNAEWERHLCEFIHEYEKGKPKQHLAMPLDLPNHDYGGIKTWDLQRLHQNLLKARALKQPLIFDTDGIGCPDDTTVRRAAWTAFVSGGHVDYLDDSLQPGSEHSGDFRGSRRATLRQQLSYLARFAKQVRFWEMQPEDGLVKAGDAFCFASERELIAYLPSGGTVTLDLTNMKGKLTARWFNPRDGKFSEAFKAQGGKVQEFRPPDGNDWVLLIGDTVRGTFSIAPPSSENKAQQSQEVYPGACWEKRSPEAVGLSRAKLDVFRDFVGGRGCVVRHGYLVYTWGDVSRRADIASAAKPIYAHFLFKALEEGMIPSLDEKVVRWEPRLNEINKELGYKDRDITWRHLANQTSCYGVVEKPGTAFCYNDWQMALFWDTLFLKVYGATYENVDEKVLRPLLTEPLQCEDDPTFMAFGTQDRPGRVAISVRDFARFGLLYLRKGSWRGRQLLSARHATMAVTSPLPNSLPRAGQRAAEMIPGQRSIGSRDIPDNQTDHFGSYSWLWWINGVDRHGRRMFPDAPADTFGAFGHDGRHALWVIPSLDIVVSYGDANLEGWTSVNKAMKLLVDATFTAPSGKRYQVSGFYDGDGRGSLDGNIWKVRFSADEVGVWGRLQYAGGHYLKFADGSYWLKGGCDDPENFDVYGRRDRGGKGGLTIQELGPMWDDLRHIRALLDGLPVNEMEPHNELLSAAKGTLTARWFNPREGRFGEPFEVKGGGVRGFKAPDRNDWALRLEKKTAMNTASATGSVEKAIQFLVNLFDPSLDLLPEFAGAKDYWLFHDNYLAAKILRPVRPDLSERIERAMRRYGITRSGKIEVVFGEARKPLPFRIPELVTIAQVGQKRIRTERLTAKVFSSWQGYADLLLLAAIAEAKANRKQAIGYFHQALAMWDGIGFYDRATEHNGRYSTYKLALALLAAGKLKEPVPMCRELLRRLRAQQDTSGGFITDYDKEGQPLGVANVETTCLAVLALTSNSQLPRVKDEASFFRVDPAHPHHFFYRNKPFFFVGKSAFALIDANWKAFIDEAHRDGFTVLRIWLCHPSLTKKHGNDRFLRNQAAGDLWPFGGTPEKPDFTRFNEDYFRRLDTILAYLQAKGMVAELTLFTGGDFWPGGPFSWDEVKQRYVQFVLGRYKGQPNLYYEIANEYYGTQAQVFVEQVGDFIWEQDKVHLVTASAGDIARFADKLWYRLHNLHASRGRDWWLRVYEQVIPLVRGSRIPVVNDEPMGSLASDDKERGYPGRDTNGAHHRMNFWMTMMGGAYVTFHSHKGINALVGYSPGQEFVRPFREFFERVRFWEMEPAPELVKAGYAFALASANELIAYLPDGGSVTLDLTNMKGKLTARWFNPREGESGDVFKVEGSAMREFKAPDGNDWVLLLKVQGR
jgi:hypothetical protein